LVDTLATERVHPWPHRDGASPGIVEGGPCRGVAAPAVVIGVVGDIVLSFPLLLALTLAFATIVGGGAAGGGGGVTGGHGSTC
jgi:hypothetical protein